MNKQMRVPFESPNHIENINLYYHIRDFHKVLPYMLRHIKASHWFYQTFNIITTLRLHRYLTKHWTYILRVLTQSLIIHNLFHNKNLIKTLDLCPKTLHNITQLFIIHNIIHKHKHHETFTII